MPFEVVSELITLHILAFLLVQGRVHSIIIYAGAVGSSNFGFWLLLFDAFKNTSTYFYMLNAEYTTSISLFRCC